MPEQNIPPRLKKAVEQAVPNAAAQPGSAARRPEDRKRLLSDVDKLLESVMGADTPAPKPAPAPKPEPAPAPRPKPAPAPAAEPPIQADIPEPPLPPIQPKEVSEPAPKTEELRFDLFGAKADPKPLTSQTIVLKKEPLKLPDEEPVPVKRPVEEHTKEVPPKAPQGSAFQPTASAAGGPKAPQGSAFQPSAPPQVERHGVMVKRVNMEMTTDLAPVPKVIPATELLQQQKGAVAAPEDVPEGQQRMEGFDGGAPEDREQRSEEEVLREIKRSRAEHTSQFEALRHLTEKLDQNGETGAPLPPEPQAIPADGEAPPFEYTDTAQREGVLRALLHAQRRQLGSMLLQGGLCLAACALLALSLVAHGPAKAAPAPEGDAALVELPLLQCLPQLLLLAGGLAANASALLRGLKGLFRRRLNADTLLLAAGAATLAQSVLCCIPGFGGYSYGALFLFLAAMQAMAQWQRARQNSQNFRFVAYRKPQTLYALRTGEEVLHGGGSAVRQQKNILYPAPMRFPGGFVAQIFREDAMDKTVRWLLPLAAGMAAIAALCGGLIAMSVGAGVSAAAAAFCLAVPAPGLLALHATLRGLNRQEKESGIAILGTGAAEEISAADGIVVDSGDLFRRSKGRMHGWREYWQVRTDEVLLYAAAIAIASGGPLQAVFEGVVEGDHSVLPRIHQLTFEDKMGLSCWIHNQKVFFGNRRLLENHGISVTLSEHEERKYEHDGRKILYLAVEKRLTAFFVVSYKPDEGLIPYFQRLRQEDRTLLVCNGDPSITLELLSEGFHLPAGTVDMLRAGQSEANRRRMRAPQEGPGASVYHSDNIRSYLRAATACLSLRGSVKRLRIWQAVGSLAAFGLLLLAALAKQLDYANALVFIAFEAIWAGLCYAGAKN